VDRPSTSLAYTVIGSRVSSGALALERVPSLLPLWTPHHGLPVFFNTFGKGEGPTCVTLTYSALGAYFVGLWDMAMGCLTIYETRFQLRLSSQHPTVLCCEPLEYKSGMLENLCRETPTRIWIELPASNCYIYVRPSEYNSGMFENLHREA
jgi:hypothetical protein